MKDFAPPRSRYKPKNFQGSFYFEHGLPYPSFILESWESEPLTAALKDIDISLVLPAPDEKHSLVVKNKNIIVGQCSMNKVTDYWQRVEEINLDTLNTSTQTFARIHRIIASAERKFLNNLGVSDKNAFHNAGLAILPKYRGMGLGSELEKIQIELCRQSKGDFLFYEATGFISAKIAKNLGFTKVIEYPYQELAKKIANSDLLKIDDCFTAWCLKLR